MNATCKHCGSTEDRHVFGVTYEGDICKGAALVHHEDASLPFTVTACNRSIDRTLAVSHDTAKVTCTECARNLTHDAIAK